MLSTTLQKELGLSLNLQALPPRLVSAAEMKSSNLKGGGASSFHGMVSCAVQMSSVPYCLFSFFTSRTTNSRYFFNSIPSNSIGSSSVFVIRCFFSSVIFVTALCNSISTSARHIWPNSFNPDAYLYID